ncbi:MAG TPA: hypothetical protein VGJ59_22060 [Jatrophihabitantaceae bacterium]
MPDEPDPRVEIVWTLAQSQLEAQKATVDELRARVGILISGAAIATGFLAGQALDTKRGIPVGAWLGIGAAAGVLVACIVILMPQEWAAQSVDTDKMLARIKAKPDQQLDDFRREMTTRAREHFKANRDHLKWLYRLFAVALILLGVDFAGWILALTQQ